MKKSNWYKIYKCLINYYFIKNRMIVELIFVSDNTATYRTLRNNKIATTRLDDFVRQFCIVNK